MLLAEHPPAHGDAPQRGEEQQVHECLTRVAHPHPFDGLSQLRSCPGTVFDERPLDRRHRPVGASRVDTLLLEPSHAGPQHLRSRQRMQPGIVLGTDEVQGASSQPRDEQLTAGQAPVDIRRRNFRPAACADRQPEAAAVLRLDREQIPNRSDRIGDRSGSKPLRRKPLRRKPLRRKPLRREPFRRQAL
jgi:hypothetical protein